MAEADMMGRRRPEQILAEEQEKYGPTYRPTQFGSNISFEETKLTSEKAKQLLPSIHNTLTGLGLLPGAGIVFDMADAAIYGLEALFAKDSESRGSAMAGMALAGTAAIPLAGIGGGLAKIGKNLQKSSDEVMSLSKEAQNIVKQAEDALARKAPPEELAKFDKAFKEIADKKLPKAKKQFSDLLNQADEALKGTKTKATETVTDATAGMPAKNRAKFLQETQNIIGDIKKSTADDIKKFNQIKAAAKKDVKGAGKDIAKATDDAGYIRYLGQTLPNRAKLSPQGRKAAAENVDKGQSKAAKQEKLYERRRNEEFTKQFGEERPIILSPTTPRYGQPNRFGVENPAGPSLTQKPQGPQLKAGDPRVSTDPLAAQSRRFRPGEQVTEPVIVRPETTIKTSSGRQIKEVNPTITRTTTDTRARGNPAQELILRQRQARRQGFSGASESQRRNFGLVPNQKRLPAPPTTSTGSTIPVPNAGRGTAGATSTPTSTSMPPINPSAAPSATRTYPTPSGSPIVNASTPTRAGRDLPFPNVPTQTVLNTTKTGKPFPRQPVRAGDEALQGTAGFTSRMPGASIPTALAMGGVMGLTAAGRAIQMSRADQQRKENQLRQEEARRQTQREAEKTSNAPDTEVASSTATAPNWRDSMPSDRVGPKTFPFNTAESLGLMPKIEVPERPQPQKSKEPVDTPEPGKVAQDDLREKMVNSIDVEKTRKREQDRINRLQLQARRAMGTGTPRGGGLQFLRTEPERLNRIEEGQASIAADQTPRDEALRRARQRMDTVRAAQRGRDQYYQDIVKGSRRRTNPYMVGPAPEIQNQTVRDAFEDTPANRERIRTMAGGQFAGLLDEDETKKPRRRRASLLRRR